MKIGSIIEIEIYGHNVQAKVLVIRPYGTIDVERISDGKCFRISGLKGTV